jgi:hypothetical protein
LDSGQVTATATVTMCHMTRRTDPATAMRYQTDPEARPSTRTLTALTAAYVVAAGCHGVLAVAFKVWGGTACWPWCC